MNALPNTNTTVKRYSQIFASVVYSGEIENLFRLEKKQTVSNRGKAYSLNKSALLPCKKNLIDL